MSPILGIWASAQQPALNATSFESIATVTVGAGGSGTITFSSIPSTYKHLQVRCFLKSGGGGNYAFRFNGATSGYFQHRLEGSGASASAAGYTSQSQIALPQTGAQWGSIIIDILDYADTNKNKTIRMLGGYDNNGSGSVGFTSGSRADTSAISSITIVETDNSWAQYSHFALYGIR